MLHRTRSVVSNAIFRWCWWNMDYHIEHHIWPAVPFHQLPELHRLGSQHYISAENDYINFFVKGKYKNEANTEVSSLT